MKQVKTKLLTSLLVATLLSVGFLGYYFGVRAGYVADESEPWLTQPLQEASYIIGEYNTTHYYARNQTGYGTAANLGYEVLSNNASEVFNDVADGLNSSDILERGRVYIRGGNYTFDSPVMVPTLTKWEGSGDATHLMLDTNADCAIFQARNEGGHGTAGVWIKNMWLDGNRDNTNTGIGILWNMTNSDNYWNTNYDLRTALHLRDVKIKNFDTYCLYASNYGATGSFHQDYVDCEFVNGYEGSLYWRVIADSYITGGYISTGGAAASAYFKAGSANIYSGTYYGGVYNNMVLHGGHNSIIRDNRFDHTLNHNIVVNGTATQHTISDNQITHTDYLVGMVYSGIYLEDTARNITITGNTFTSEAEPDLPKYCIEEAGTTSDNFIQGNNFIDYNVTNTAVSIRAGSNTIVRYNKGYVTENSGISINATATTWTITHGMAGTPTGVWCSFNSTNVDTYKWTSTATTITVTCVNRATTDAIVACYWHAIYDPT